MLGIHIIGAATEILAEAAAVLNLEAPSTTDDMVHAHPTVGKRWGCIRERAGIADKRVVTGDS